MPTPKVYLLDAENKVKSHVLTREMALGGTDTRAELRLNVPGLIGIQGAFFPAGPGWSYRHTGPGSCAVNTGTEIISLGTSSGSRLRMGGTDGPSGQTAVALKSGYTLHLSGALVYYTFRDDAGSWARLAVPETGALMLSRDRSNPSTAGGQAAVFYKNGQYYLDVKESGAVKLRGKAASGTVALGQQNVITLGQQLFFWNQGVLHYLSTGDNPTTFRINSYGSGIRITPTVSPVNTSPAGPSGTPAAKKLPACMEETPSGGIRITPAGKKITPVPVTPPPAVSPLPAKPKLSASGAMTPAEARKKAIAMAKRASETAGYSLPVKMPSATPRRVSGRLPGKDTLKISIRERSVRNLLHKKVLLKDISLDVQTGEMVLILGGSGAGKTTFMNAVMGYEPADGTISFKGMNVYEEYEKMKYMIGFVPQQDLMRDSDTVYETLKNAGEMKLPANTTQEQLENRVTEVLGLMGLEAEKINLVKKLSGGQRKRLSIAQEYIGNPTLFFLDEPDSGLDGGMAKSLMEKLRTIADSQKIVMLISHQPDRTAELFDKIIVLAKGTTDNCGHLAFFGSVEETKRFFGVTALEQVVQKINRKDEGGEGLSDYFIEKFARGRG